MASEEIKQKFKELVVFNVETDYYKEDDKEKMAAIFKDILFEDDVVVRNFLEKTFASMVETARELELIGIPEEIEVEETEDEEEIETDEEDTDETTEETTDVDEDEVEPETEEGAEEDVGDETTEEEDGELYDNQQFDSHAYMRERANDFI